jgi:tRNA-2-methylthio-N6-dimethylallyladenosine synthase
MAHNQSKTYYIKTFGCQANVADSEKIAGFLIQAGLEEAQTIDKADIVVINSCSVRQSAEDRAIGLAHNLSQKKPRPLIIITGCLLYHQKKYLKEKLGQKVDFMVKTKKWPEFIVNNWAIEVKDQPQRKSRKMAYVPIMEGCNNFCTYCVVPHARGREQSVLPEEVICQVNQAIKSGYQQVLLLGQNVNSYGKDLKKTSLKYLRQTGLKTPFAGLLFKLNGLKNLKKISFLTSNPQDLDGDIISALSLPKINRQLHLPVQSGDDQILAAMNRKYTTVQYIKLVEKIRKKIPDIKISTDIIVGFPGETKRQFQNTVSFCQKVGFNKAYINKYSPRPQTAAAKLTDSVSWAEKKRRWRVLEKMINNC